MNEYSEEVKADMVAPYVDGIERNARALYMRYILDNCLMDAVLPVRDNWTAHNEEQHEQQ